MWRHGEAERLRGLEIDHQFILGGSLHRHVSRLLAFQDAANIIGRKPILFGGIRAIAHQTTSTYKIAEGIDGRQPVLGHKRDDLLALHSRYWTRRNDDAAIRSAREQGDRTLKLALIAYIKRGQLNTQMTALRLEEHRAARCRML